MSVIDDILKAGGYIPQTMTQNPFDNPYFAPQERGGGSEMYGSGLGRGWLDWEKVGDPGLLAVLNASAGNADGVSGGGADPQALLRYMQDRGYRLFEEGTADPRVFRRGVIGPDGKPVGGLQDVTMSNDDAFGAASILAGLAVGGAVGQWAAAGNGLGGAAATLGTLPNVAPPLAQLPAIEAGTTALGGTGLASGVAGGMGLSAPVGAGSMLGVEAAGAGSVLGAAGSGLTAAGLSAAAPTSLATTGLGAGSLAAAGTTLGLAGSGLTPTGLAATPASSVAATGLGAGGAISAVPGVSSGLPPAAGAPGTPGVPLPGGGPTSIIDKIGDAISKGSLTDWAGLLMSLYGMNQASDARREMDPFAPYRKGYAEKLQALEANPSLITQTPGYQAGIDAVERQSAASGFYGSGNMALGLSRFAGDFLNSERDRLATLAGAGQRPGAGIPTALEWNSGYAGAIGNIIRNWGQPRP